METTVLDLGLFNPTSCIGTTEYKMETAILGLGFRGFQSNSYQVSAKRIGPRQSRLRAP